MTKRVLFIHHGSIAGGAPLSMLYTMQGIREAGYEVIAGLLRPSKELHALYNSNGFATIEVPWIPIFITWSGSEGKKWNPFMWYGVINAWLSWGRAKKRLETLIKEVGIDIIHLNSVALSNPASLLLESDFPFVWHVREHGPSHKGLRYRFIQKRLLQASEVIFLSQAERRSWVGETNQGTVVNNFVDFSRFDASISKQGSRKELNLLTDAKVILYVGGKKKHKGVVELLKALVRVALEISEPLVCLMPDAAMDDESANSFEKRLLLLIEEGGLADKCKLLPFNPDIVHMFAACDVLVFPATKPHFARPVIEASAMGKPVVASDLPAIDELVISGETGFLVDAKSPHELSDAIVKVLTDSKLAEKMGKAGKVFALKHFEQHSQMQKVLAVYQRLL